MYEAYWGLTESPFANTLEPRWFFESPAHEEAFARLLYLADHGRRCGLLFGHAGTGKSLLAELVIRHCRRSQTAAALVDFAHRPVREILWDLAALFGLGPQPWASEHELWRTVGDHLLANRSTHRPTVLVLDHLDQAQPDLTAVLRRLIHLGATSGAGLTLLLLARSGQVNSVTTLAGELSDLRIELHALDLQQTHAYVEALLSAAGATRRIFEHEALDEVYNLSQGTPREINRLCDLALLGAMADGSATVSEATVQAAADDLLPTTRARRIPAWAEHLG